MIIEVGGPNSDTIAESYLTKYPSDVLERYAVGYKSANWECRDGTKGEESISGCKSVSDWLEYAKDKCDGKCNQGMCGIYSFNAHMGCDYTSCEDSDNGKDYFIKGHTEGTTNNKNMPFRIGTDHCSGVTLNEFYCENGMFDYELIDCQNGCDDGACIPFYEDDQDIEVPKEEIDSSQDCPIKTCEKISETCIGQDKVVMEKCEVYIKTGNECIKNTVTNSKVIQNSCDGQNEEDVDCQGCQIDSSTCIPFGTRLQKENLGYFCDINKKMEEQKGNSDSCQNSYECISNNCKSSICSPICSGCLDENNNCIPYGTRIKSDFCNIDNRWIAQKDESNACDNDYECASNVCVNNECVSHNLIQKVISWFKNLFG